METRDKFFLFERLIDKLPSGSQLTYSPVARAFFLLDWDLGKYELCGNESFYPPCVSLPGGNAKSFPQKREIKKVGFFSDEDFLKNILFSLRSHGVTVEKLNIPNAKSVKKTSAKQKEEIEFYLSLYQPFGVDRRGRMETFFFSFNGLIESYLSLLANKDIDAVFCRCYYIPAYLPMILACKILGITVIDVQHGMNGFHHLGYSRIKGCEKNTPLLPDVFWVWSEMAKSMIEKNSMVGDVSTIVCGGNPVFSECNPVKKKTKLLYSHQPLSKGVRIPLEEIKKASELSGSDVVVRPHPLHLDEARSVMEMLKSGGVSARLEDPRTVTINDSLAESFFHVTHYSTCALDALNQGVPSFYVSDHIGDVEKEFRTGLLFRIDEVSGRLPEVGSPIDYSLGSNDKIENAVSELLGFS